MLAHFSTKLLERCRFDNCRSAGGGRVRNVCQGSKQAMRQEEGQHNRTQYAHPARSTYSTLTLPPEFTTQYMTTNERARARYTGGKHADGRTRTDDGARACITAARVSGLPRNE